MITYLCVSIRFGVCLGLQNISILLQKNVFSIPFFIDRFTMWQTQNHVDQTGKRVSFFEIRNKATTCPMSPRSQAHMSDIVKSDSHGALRLEYFELLS